MISAVSSVSSRRLERSYPRSASSRKRVSSASFSLNPTKVYCHRKFRSLSKPRLCYNTNLIERSLRNVLTQVRVFDTCRISTKKLVLNLLNCGLNKRWHFTISDLFFTLLLVSICFLPIRKAVSPKCEDMLSQKRF